MPEIRRPGWHASRIAAGGSPEMAGRRGYRVRPDDEREVARQLSPGQIVAVLHARIAAMDPERAALVAEFERIQQEMPR